MTEINIYINGDGVASASNDVMGNEVKISDIRGSPMMASAKKKVKSRDVCCQVCGEQDKQLQCHHILPVALYPDLAYDDKNMITVCQVCHAKYHDLYEGSEGAENFAKFMRDYGGKL